MAEPSPPNSLILLTDDEKLGRMTVQLEGFMAFTDQLITDLEKLEEDWRGTASPPLCGRALNIDADGCRIDGMANSQSSDAPDEPQGVYHTSDPNSAHMLKALLADYGITAHVVGDASLIASAEFGMGRGVISVVVNSRDFTVARGISTAFQRHLFGSPSQVDSPQADSPQEHEPEAHWADWPVCRNCGKPRQTRCPICRTAGSEFRLADPGPLRVQSAVSLICPICDDPFEPKFYRTCSWCGHEHNDGLPFDETVITAEENDRSVMVAALLAIFLMGLFYLLYTFRP